MKKHTLFRFYFLGTCIRYLQDLTPPARINGNGFVRSNIEMLFKYFDALELSVTSRLARGELSEVLEHLEEIDREDSGFEFSESETIKINSSVSAIRKTMDAELNERYAFVPTPKRLALHKLLDSVHEIFCPDAFDSLPEIARYDFSYAGKCIAFELPTAAAFHVLRATESVLRSYYEAMIKQKRIKSRNWGPIVNDLRARRATSKHEVLNNHLDNIRASFRNPTQHPDKIYDIHEVQDLYSLCVDVVNRMVAVTRKANKPMTSNAGAATD
ncbi:MULTISPECIES: hypothetical protein [Idiomarina]|uniref:hypothetical protein n=1 Tax=Idiomarina TaxID=135575 RepID=UPI0010115BD7|nr:MULTISPECIES: hypothetical protein [Idiomarina]MTJ01535.1 hypothetical protein [Idiomarina piscisalsi]RXS43245.1 hypothetical protein EST55_05775 [Idiomarina sp. 29L]